MRRFLAIGLILLPWPAAAQDVVISEFLAINDGSSTDDFGDPTDWVELFNAGATTVSLDGWSLTDDPEFPEKFVFPAVSLAPGAFRVVYCSGKNRRDPARALHTSFKLSGLGEYLGLFRPGGDVAFEYAPYPPQVAGYSYGLAQNGSSAELVTAGAAVRALVPTDGSLGTAWLLPGFDDSGWLSGSLGVGYDRDTTYDSLISLDVEPQMYGSRTSVYLRIPFTAADPGAVSSFLFRMKYDDGFVAWVNGQRIASALAPATPSWDSTATANHDDAAALVYEDFEASPGPGVLEEGENVLAIQGLNSGTGSSDFVIFPELLGFSSGELQPDVRQYFPRPSPGRGNLEGYPGVAEKPAASVPGGVVASGTTVSLSTPGSGATIRYTLNGSEPTAASPAYSGPIAISTTTMLRARGFSGEDAPSPILTVGYLVLASDLATFSSDLPIAVIENFGAGSVPQNDYQAAFLAMFDTDGSRSRLTDPPHIETRIGIKVRGSSTSGDPKRSYGFEAWDDLNEDKEIAPLGLPAEADWILYAPYSFDIALLRNPFVYEISNQAGRYAVRTRFVEVFVNTGGGNLARADHAGVYVLMEKIERDRDRVDIEELPVDATAEPEIAGGYMLKIDRLDPGDSGIRAGNQTLGFVYPKESEVSPGQSAWIRGYIDQFYTALQGAGFADPVNGYARWIDADAWIDHHLINVLAKNVDALRLSTYMFKSRDGKLEMGPVWDFDRSINSTDGRDDSPTTWNGTGDGTDYFNYPWWDRLFDDPEFWLRYQDRWFGLRKGAFATANLHAVIDGMANEVREAAARNFDTWRISTVTGWQNDVNNMKTWLSARAAWIDGQFLAPPVPSHPGGPIEPGLELSLSAPSGTIHYTTDGRDPRLRGGAILSGATQYGGPIVLDRNVRLFARTRSGTGTWSAAAVATYVVETPRLVVTELMYHPTRPPEGSPLDADDFEFIELLNAGTEALDLAGFRFTEGIEFTFPSRVLEPGERIVVVEDLAAFSERYDADDLPIAGEYQGNLSNAGDTLALEGPLGEPILRFGYDDQWFLQTDGGGYSLVYTGPLDDLDAWALPESWSAGTTLGGTPGVGEDGAPLGGWQLPADATQSGTIDIADAVSILVRLFSGSGGAPPCDGAGLEDGGNLTVLDASGDGRVDVSDAVWLLTYLFRSGPPPAAGVRCLRVPGCPDVCGL